MCNFHFLLLQVSTTLSVIIDLIPFSTIIVLNCLIYNAVKFNLLKMHFINNITRLSISHQVQRKTSLLPRNAKRERRGLYIATILILIVLVYAICHRCVSSDMVPYPSYSSARPIFQILSIYTRPDQT